jgi:hypothetical protein
VCNSETVTVQNIKISFPDSIKIDEVYKLPFLGAKEKINIQVADNEISFTIPEIGKGMVILMKRN